MSPSASSLSLTLAERRLRLVLACELDRMHLKLALKPRPTDDLKVAGLPLSSFSKAFSIAQLLPGKIGRWSRRAALGAELFAAFNPFARR